MEQYIEDSLLKAIKSDDIKAFDALMKDTRCETYRLGRFPLLSLMYLYKSRRILSAYEERLLKIASYSALREPIEISRKFSVKAGKCLRLYIDEVVTPVEMLMILNKTKRLRSVYPLARPSADVRKRLKSIYFIRYSLSVKFVGESIVLDRRPLTYREKRNVLTACVSLVLTVAIIVGVPVTTVSLLQKPADSGDMTLSQIDFASTKEYTLKNDIVIPENYALEKINCTIKGEGKKLILGKSATLGELNGAVSDVTFETKGDPIFSSLTVNATIENVTVNVDADVVATDGSAFVALTNYGTIESVTVNVKGKVDVLASTDEVSDEIAFGGIVQNNDYKVNNLTQTIYKRGIINNCTVNYSEFTLTGEASANATFGGVAGINAGFLQNCTVNGDIVADTFDIAGVCSINNWGLVDNVNNANLLQTSADDNWNPNTCGIVLNNGYAVERCENHGNITAISTCEDMPEQGALAVIASGIACINSNQIVRCTNDGAVTATGYGLAYVGGIASRSVSLISNCVSSGDISATAKSVYAGGILARSEVTTSGRYIYFGTVEYCVSENKISAESIEDGSTYVGGIAGYVQEREFNQQSFDESGALVEQTVYFGGGVTGCYFTGECERDVLYFGNIVGVCGLNIYESNTYTSGLEIYHNFDGNVYAEGSSYGAFGATESPDGTFALAPDKGATSSAVEDIKNSDGYKNILGE